MDIVQQAAPVETNSSTTSICRKWHNSTDSTCRKR